MCSNMLKSIFIKLNNQIRKDGWLHIGVSFALMFVLSTLIYFFGNFRDMMAIPAFLTFIIGMAKELYDSFKKNQMLEKHDIICNLAGIFIAQIIIIILVHIPW